MKEEFYTKQMIMDEYKLSKHKLPNTINRSEYDPIVWMEDNDILYVVNKQQYVEEHLSDLGIGGDIQFYDVRCNDKWMYLPRKRQLYDVVESIMSNGYTYPQLYSLH